jgi:hypothetical protein
MLAYSSARIKTTVLTNAMLLRGPRLEKLCYCERDLIVQVNWMVDGLRITRLRGPGTWERP